MRDGVSAEAWKQGGAVNVYLTKMLSVDAPPLAALDRSNVNYSFLNVLSFEARRAAAALTPRALAPPRQVSKRCEAVALTAPSSPSLPGSRAAPPLVVVDGHSRGRLLHLSILLQCAQRSLPLPHSPPSRPPARPPALSPSHPPRPAPFLLASAPLLLQFESMTVGDRDTRDMLWDFHITTVGSATQHLSFRAATWKTQDVRVWRTPPPSPADKSPWI